jgi:hypothetical protein
MVRQELAGEIDSWAIWWSWAILDADGVCLNPVRSYIKNIGFDDSGTHGRSQDLDVALDGRDVDDLNFPSTVNIDERLNRRYNRFIDGGRRMQLKRRLATVLKQLRLFWLYRSIRNDR